MHTFTVISYLYTCMPQLLIMIENQISKMKNENDGNQTELSPGNEATNIVKTTQYSSKMMFYVVHLYTEAIKA